MSAFMTLEKPSDVMHAALRELSIHGILEVQGGGPWTLFIAFKLQVKRNNMTCNNCEPRPAQNLKKGEISKQNCS
jgi:hypothetical protein